MRREIVETSASLNQRTLPTIPASQFARIRTLVKYGMTIPQVAQVCGVAVEEIERILREG
jgi:hypothetical protein